MTETGTIKQNRTQVGEVRRPLQAVSELSKANQITFFCQDEDWIIDRRDPVADQLVALVRKAKAKTRMYEHRGTYRMRAWMIPGDGTQEEAAKSKGSVRPFGRQGP